MTLPDEPELRSKSKRGNRQVAKGWLHPTSKESHMAKPDSGSSEKER